MMANNVATAPPPIVPAVSSAIPPTVPPAVPPAVPPVVPIAPTPWRQNFPAVLSGVLSFLQFAFAVLIIGCELGSVLIDMITATIYVGFWAGLFFLAAAISQSSACM